MDKVLFFIAFISQIFVFPAFGGFLKLSENTSAIYKKDDRGLVDVKSSQIVKTLSESIAMIISNESLEKNLFSTTIFAGLLENTEGMNFCKDIAFAKHHSLEACTGFLVGEDLLATAGHCFATEADCSNKTIVFNVLAKNEIESGYLLSAKNTFECKEIVSSGIEPENNLDFAVIRLNRKVFDRPILKLRNEGSLSGHEKVFMIGHPLGLPQVVTNSVSILENGQPHFFKAELDSFEGNSGSPVFNSKTFEVEGILVRGQEDFLLDQSLQCYREQVYNQGENDSPGLKGEEISRISEILPSLGP